MRKLLLTSAIVIGLTACSGGGKMHTYWGPEAGDGAVASGYSSASNTQMGGAGTNYQPRTMGDSTSYQVTRPSGGGESVPFQGSTGETQYYANSDVNQAPYSQRRSW